MRRLLRVVALALVLGLGGGLAAARQDVFPEDITFHVWFAPGFNASSRACNQIKWLGSKGSAKLAVPVLDSGTLCDALVRAHDAGADVRVLMPRSGLTARGSLASVLVAAKIPILIDDQHKGPGPRWLIVNDNRVFTGAFGNNKPEAGWGDAGDFCSKEFAAHYLAEWGRHVAHAEPYPPVKDP